MAKAQTKSSPKKVAPAPKKEAAKPEARKNAPLTEKQLQKKVTEGTATSRQQGRLEFLQKQNQKKAAAGGKNPSYTIKKDGKNYDLSTAKGGIGATEYYNDQYGREQFEANRPNVYNPFGSETWEQDPETGQWSQRQGLAPEEQLRLDQQRGFDSGLGNIGQGAMGQLEKQWQNPYSLEGFANDPRTMDFSADRARIEEGLMADFDRRNSERFGKETEDFQQQMQNRGIPMGSELYTKEADNLRRRQADEREAARTSALQMGGSEMERSFGLGSQARGQAISEYDAVRDRPFKELSSALGQISGPMLPQFQQRSNIDVARIDPASTGLAYGQLGQQKYEYDQTMALQREQMAKAGRGGGGGGGENLSAQQKLDMSFADWQRKQDYLRGFDTPKPRRPSPGENIAQGVAGGLGAGLGTALGNYWGS